MIVISNTSPIINLAVVGKLDLMAKAGFWVDGELYNRVLQAAGEIE